MSEESTDTCCGSRVSLNGIPVTDFDFKVVSNVGPKLRVVAKGL